VSDEPIWVYGMSSLSTQRESPIPRVSGVIRRPRLLAKLQDAAAHKLLLICAPPGYGKTTIAAQFAAQAPYPVAWHTIEERERDVPNLYNQSVAALEYVIPSIQDLTPVPGYTPGELAALIADHLRDNLDKEIFYVMDDAHLIAGSPAAELWLTSLVRLIPANCHLVLISRILPNLPLTEMIARGEVIALGQEQLRFTREEVHHLVDEALVAHVPHADLDSLTTRLEGWPAGIALAIHPLPSELERAMLSGGEGPEALFSALANSTLRAQPSGLANFLLASSTLNRMTPDLCSTVLQLPDSGYWMNEAQNRNLFLSRVAGGLVYHRLFRDFLQRQLKTDNFAQYAALHTRSAQWFEENHRLDDSFEHYMAAGLVERAAAIAERVAHSYFAQGKVETLLKWRAQLGQIGIFAPSLLYNCARIYTDRYDYSAAEIALDEAERGYAAEKNKSGAANVQVQRAMIKLQTGDYQAAAAQAKQLAVLHAKAPGLRGRALKVLGVASLRMGESRNAVLQLEEAVQLHREDGDAYALANVLQDLGVAYSRQGRLDEASACLQEVVVLRRRLGSAGALALALNNLGYYYHRGGDYKQAQATLQEGLSVAARMPNRRAESYLLWSMGDLQRDRGAFDEALGFYNKALELLGTSEPALRCSILISTSSLQRWHETPRDAVALAEDAVELAQTHHMVVDGLAAQASLWVAKAQLGETRLALEKLEVIVDELQQQGARFELVWAYALCAYTALLASNTPTAETYLLAGLRLAQEVGSAQPMAAEILHSRSFEAYVLNNFTRFNLLGKELNYLREAQVKTSAARKTRIPEPHNTYSLRVWTLGQEQIERDGELIPASEWRADSARELFFYLLFNDATSREQMSLVFWPDSSPKRVRANFHTTLYRARQAVGEHVITFQDGLYQINPDIDLWCDAQEMETATGAARLLSSRDARTEDLWDRAVKLYRGDFLPSWDAEWVIYRRENLAEAYLEALVGLGDCARARKNLKEAVAAFRRALDVDPYREDIHRAIMICYAENGEKQQVMAHWQKLQDLLRLELGIAPSAETLELAESLLT